MRSKIPGDKRRIRKQTLPHDYWLQNKQSKHNVILCEWASESEEPRAARVRPPAAEVHQVAMAVRQDDSKQAQTRRAWSPFERCLPYQLSIYTHTETTDNSRIIGLKSLQGLKKNRSFEIHDTITNI